MNPDPDRPTSVRFAVVGVTTLAAVLLYLDRICISFAERFIKQDLSLSDGQMSWVLSAFFWSYALGQVPSGWLSDRFGGRVTLTAYALLWSLLTAATGWAGGLVSLLAVRLGFGLAQAGAYPTAALLLSKWVPFTARATASSVVAFGGRIGGAVAPLLTGALIVAFVPVSVSSRITRDDLIDVYMLSTQIARPDAEPKITLASRLLASANVDFSQTVESFAELYEAELERVRAEAAEGKTGATRRELDPTHDAGVAVIAAELNRVLDRSDLYDERLFDEVPLEREASNLLRRPRDELTSEQLQRLNRLLLEAVYADGIRKVYVAGWRKTMFVFGTAGIFVALLFWLTCRDLPANHPRCNAAERSLIEHVRPATEPRVHAAARGLPIEDLLRSRSLWLSCVSQFGTNLGWVFLITWLPRYLQEVHQVPVISRGLMASVPLFAGWFGMLGGGWLTDLLTRRLGLRWGRGLPMSLTRFAAMAAFLVVLLPMSPWAATICFAVVAFSTDLGVSSVWAYMQDVGGRHVASILGWGNMWGNLGAAASPLVIGWMVAQHKNWDAAFLTCSAAFLISGLAALGVDATKPIARAENEIK
jgi:nitrate/nitrite transporter NarK